MAIDIFNLQPSVINKSLSGKSILLAGEPKIGKSEFCAQSPDTLILDFENGYNMHYGVKKVNITKWADVKQILRQLERPEAKNLYKNIVFDTLNEAWDLCTNHICIQNSVQKIKDIPYGQGYKDRDNEFAETLRKILNLNYGLIVTCHTKEKLIDSQNDIDITSLAPDLDKRCVPIINGLVDIMGMITKSWNSETNEWDRWLITQATPNVSAGSRIKYLAPKIPFGYQHLENALAAAITESEKHGAIVVDKEETVANEKLNYKDVRNEATRLWNKLVDPNGANPNEEMANRIAKKAEMIFGHSIKLSEIAEDQTDLFNLLVLDMQDLEKEI